MRSVRAKELANRLAGIWWAASMNRWRDQTGIAHVVHDGGALCGAKPFSMGGSYPSAEATGCKECKRCRNILTEVINYANSCTVRSRK